MMNSLLKLSALCLATSLGAAAMAVSVPPTRAVNLIRVSAADLINPNPSQKDYSCTLVSPTGDSWLSNIQIGVSARSLDEAATLALTTLVAQPLGDGRADVVQVTYKNIDYVVREVKCSPVGSSI